MYAKQKHPHHLLPIVPHVQQTQQLEYSINQIVQDTHSVILVLQVQPLQFVLDVMMDIT